MEKMEKNKKFSEKIGIIFFVVICVIVPMNHICVILSVLKFI